MPKGKTDIGGTEKPGGYLKEIGYDPAGVQSGKSRNTINMEPSMKSRVDKTDGIRRISLRLIVLIVGLVLLISSTLFAVSTIDSDEPRGLKDTEEYQLFKEVLASDLLNYDKGPGSSVFDSGKVMAADSGSIKESIINENALFGDYQFIIEIIDISGYSIHYNRTISENTAIGTSPLPGTESGIDVTIFETGVNIFVSSHEIHSAKLRMHVWRS